MITTVQLETDRVRVVRYDLEPGDRIPHHRHEYDYVAVPLDDADFELVTTDGTSHHSVARGGSYNRAAGSEHELVNGSRPYSFIEIELLA
jgi:hypothetical protein